MQLFPVDSVVRKPNIGRQARQRKMIAAEVIGMKASVLPALAATRCPYPFEPDAAKAKQRVDVAALCLVFATLVSYTKENRPDISIEDFSTSLLHGMSHGAKLSSGTSAYEILIISSFEKKAFREHSSRALRSDAAVNDLFSDQLTVPQLFTGIAFFRENLFRTISFGGENGFSYRMSVSFVGSAREWLVPRSANADACVAFVDSLQRHLMSDFMGTLFSKIERAQL
jgi:hypothetical protein